MRRYTPSPPPPPPPRRRTTTFTDAAAPPPSRRRYGRSSPAATRRRRLVTRTRPEHQYPSATQPTTTYADDFRTWEWLPPPPRARSRSREPVVIRERVEHVSPDRRRRRRRRRASGGERLGFGAPDVRAGVPAQTYAQEEEEEEEEDDDDDDEDDEHEEEDVRVRWPAEFGGGAGWLGWEDRAGMRYDDFALSRRDRGVFGVLAAEDEGDSGEGEGEGEKEVVEEMEERADETRLRVRFSEWLENGSGGEDPVAELVVEPDVGVMRKVKGKKGLFDWL
ncbi:hypothetical protein GTA08_BOTSDO04714 [Botryosphaeria dothidea]|uniref:Uncharacterized protein n=1 Tax=Botryosphaeria dothidea TaxID=55169 RepID=A0A8H4IVF2_9PEZI|nr:hypothetical protein GTA08_BOTSDO04714 [Botryosphaeria dothidea]